MLIYAIVKYKKKFIHRAVVRKKENKVMQKDRKAKDTTTDI